MENCENYKEVCNVRQMADKVGLSTSRFYELVGMNVFPRPLRCEQTGRPFYPLSLQNVCLEIRKTGIGLNGKLVLFYRPREKPVNGGRGTSRSKSRGLYEEIASDLRCMQCKVTAEQVKTAIKTLYPQGLKQISANGELIKKLYNYFRNRV
jgi:hypothetical protein